MKNNIIEGVETIETLRLSMKYDINEASRVGWILAPFEVSGAMKYIVKI